MPSTISPSVISAARSSRARGDAAGRSGGLEAGRVRRRDHQRTSLARYVDGQGRAREVVAQAGFQGSVLVVDRDAATLGDRRLVAHLCADEPRENAVLVCGSYVHQARRGGYRCRSLTPADFLSSPLADEDDERPSPGRSPGDIEPIDRMGRTYRLQPLCTAMSIPELRWRRHSPPPASDQRVVSVREAVAALESYEPIRMLTMNALVLARGERELSTAVLRAELVRLRLSPIVLNRRLREVALAHIEREGLSLSEIATRCGRVKRDASGNESGETSWLARRMGLLPEGGKERPTPWIHSDVLALIARRGLGLSPREVEVE
jgi:hypothetical protein